MNHVILQLQNLGAITMLWSADGTEGVEFRLEEGNVLVLFSKHLQEPHRNREAEEIHRRIFQVFCTLVFELMPT